MLWLTGRMVNYLYLIVIKPLVVSAASPERRTFGAKVKISVDRVIDLLGVV